MSAKGKMAGEVVKTGVTMGAEAVGTYFGGPAGGMAAKQAAAPIAEKAGEKAEGVVDKDEEEGEEETGEEKKEAGKGDDEDEDSEESWQMEAMEEMFEMMREMMGIDKLESGMKSALMGGGGAEGMPEAESMSGGLEDQIDMTGDEGLEMPEMPDMAEGLDLDSAAGMSMGGP